MRRWDVVLTVLVLGVLLVLIVSNVVNSGSFDIRKKAAEAVVPPGCVYCPSNVCPVGKTCDNGLCRASCLLAKPPCRVAEPLCPPPSVSPTPSACSYASKFAASYVVKTALGTGVYADQVFAVVNDYASSTYKVRVYSKKADATFGQLVREWGAAGYGDGQFWTPSGIALDANNNVYVIDGDYSHGYRVQYFSPTGTFLGKFGVTGKGNGQFYFLNGAAITIDKSRGWVYVADMGGDTCGGRVQRFTLNGVWQKTNPTGRDKCNATDNWDLGRPGDLVVEPVTGDIYYLDALWYRVVRVNSNLDIPWVGVWDNSVGGLKHMPLGADIDAGGNLFVASTRAASSVPPVPIHAYVLKWSPTGVLLDTIGSYGTGDGQYVYPTDVAVDNGSFLVSDSLRSDVQKNNCGGLVRSSAKPVTTVTPAIKKPVPKPTAIIRRPALPSWLQKWMQK